MTDNTPDASLEPTPVPTPAEPYSESPDVLADVAHPVGSSYDPMPLQVSTAKDNNWMGVVALITGIVGISLVAIIFGILGLSAVKKGKATNKGMSIAGIILGGVWIVLGIVLAVVALMAIANSTTIASAKVGDCYVSTVVASDNLEYANPKFGSCETGTNAEIYYVSTYTGDSLPTDAGIQDELTALCTSPEAIKNVDTDIATEYYVEYYLPYADTWDTDPHTVLCGLSTDSGVIDPNAVDE